jgi:divalent metal cation (Fe/Co/Zn/Cd) transporter
MQSQSSERRQDEADRDKGRVALSSLAAAVVLTVTKLVIGLLT